MGKWRPRLLVSVVVPTVIGGTVVFAAAAVLIAHRRRLSLSWSDFMRKKFVPFVSAQREVVGEWLLEMKIRVRTVVRRGDPSADQPSPNFYFAGFLLPLAKQLGWELRGVSDEYPVCAAQLRNTLDITQPQITIFLEDARYIAATMRQERGGGGEGDHAERSARVNSRPSLHFTSGAAVSLDEYVAQSQKKLLHNNPTAAISCQKEQFHLLNVPVDPSLINRQKQNKGRGNEAKGRGPTNRSRSGVGTEGAYITVATMLLDVDDPNTAVKAMRTLRLHYCVAVLGNGRTVASLQLLCSRQSHEKYKGYLGEMKQALFSAAYRARESVPRVRSVLLRQPIPWYRRLFGLGPPATEPITWRTLLERLRRYWRMRGYRGSLLNEEACLVQLGHPRMHSAAPPGVLFTLQQGAIEVLPSATAEEGEPQLAQLRREWREVDRGATYFVRSFRTIGLHGKKSKQGQLQGYDSKRSSTLSGGEDESSDRCSPMIEAGEEEEEEIPIAAVDGVERSELDMSETIHILQASNRTASTDSLSAFRRFSPTHTGSAPLVPCLPPPQLRLLAVPEAELKDAVYDFYQRHRQENSSLFTSNVSLGSQATTASEALTSGSSFSRTTTLDISVMPSEGQGQPSLQQQPQPAQQIQIPSGASSPNKSPSSPNTGAGAGGNTTPAGAHHHQHQHQRDKKAEVLLLPYCTVRTLPTQDYINGILRFCHPPSGFSLWIPHPETIKSSPTMSSSRGRVMSVPVLSGSDTPTFRWNPFGHWMVRLWPFGLRKRCLDIAIHRIEPSVAEDAELFGPYAHQPATPQRTGRSSGNRNGSGRRAGAGGRHDSSTLSFTRGGGQAMPSESNTIAIAAHQRFERYVHDTVFDQFARDGPSSPLSMSVEDSYGYGYGSIGESEGGDYQRSVCMRRNNTQLVELLTLRRGEYVVHLCWGWREPMPVLSASRSARQTSSASLDNQAEDYEEPLSSEQAELYRSMLDGTVRWFQWGTLTHPDPDPQQQRTGTRDRN